MKLISVGRECNVRHQIDIHNKFKGIDVGPTLFFDWLRIALPSVTQVIGASDIASLIKRDAIMVAPHLRSHEGHARVFLKSLEYCESIHDLPLSYTDADIESFIAKFRRRWGRLIDLIENSTERIYFIHYATHVSVKDCEELCYCISKRNHKLHFFVVGMAFAPIEKTEVDHFIPLDINLYLKTSYDRKDWKTSFVDWARVWQDILKQ